MNDRRRKELLSQYDELTMQLLMDEAAEADGRLLLEGFHSCGMVPMPRELDEACKKRILAGFKRGERKQRWKKAIRSGLRVAVISLCLLVGMYGLVMKVDAVRIPVLNYGIVTYEKFSTIVFGDQKPTPAPKNLREVMEGLIPVGYTLFAAEEYSPDSIFITFVSGEDVLALNTWSGYDSTNVNTENALVYESVICEVPVLVRERYDPDYGFVSIIWLSEDETVVYDLTATALSIDDLIHIAAPLIEFTAK